MNHFNHKRNIQFKESFQFFNKTVENVFSTTPIPPISASNSQTVVGMKPYSPITVIKGNNSHNSFNKFNSPAGTTQQFQPTSSTHQFSGPSGKFLRCCIIVIFY